MTKKHSFNFEVGEYLTTMGASWFVSYSFYLRNKEFFSLKQWWEVYNEKQTL